jgi:hypothetical protein
MINLPTKRQINDSRKPTPYTFGNQILYDLCKQNLYHKKTDKILAKVLIIGRTYAVALDRNKREKGQGEDFYLDKVVPAFKKSKIDINIASIKKYKKITLPMIPELLRVHKSLTKELNELTKHNKRSFSSKYLHFHLPHLFYVLDSRAVKAMRNFVSRLPSELKELIPKTDVDNHYATFFYKCFHLNEQINKKYTRLSPRELDNFLLKVKIISKK